MRGESFAPGFDTQTLLAAIFLFSTVVYSCVRTSGKSSSLSIQSDDASIEEVLLVEEDKDGVSAQFFLIIVYSILPRVLSGRHQYEESSIAFIKTCQ